MKLPMFLATILSTSMSFAHTGEHLKAQVDTQKLAAEMSVMTRTMDVLFGRQEMKDSLTSDLVQNFLRVASDSTASHASDVDKKVAILTDTQTLGQCQSSHNETRSKNGDKIDALVEYKGTDCPFVITANIHVVTSATGANGDLNLEVEIRSEKIKAEIDMVKFNMPMKIKVTVAPIKGGMSLNTDMSLGANMLSQKFGSVDYSAGFVTQLIFGSDSQMQQVNTETFTSRDQTIKFVRNAQSNSKQNSETYSINEVAVSKAEFEKQHATISLPGFDDQKAALATAQSCEIKTYDTSVYSLEEVRKDIRNNTTQSLKTSESFPQIDLVETGKLKLPVSMADQMIEINIATTPDVARFTFEKNQDDGSLPETLGRLTAVFGEKLELTKVILNRVVRITCAPKR